MVQIRDFGPAVFPLCLDFGCISACVSGSLVGESLLETLYTLRAENVLLEALYTPISIILRAILCRRAKFSSSPLPGRSGKLNICVMV